MTVRRAVIFAATLVACLALLAFRDRSDSVPLCDRCNVVLVSMDTLRADRLGAYGYTRPTSPAFDAFAAKSVLFEEAISQSAWTRPAHASMLTGLYPAEHGIVLMSRDSKLSREAPTIASALSQRGYATAAFTGGANMAAHFGFDNGFDIYRSPGRRVENSLGDVERWLDRLQGEPFFLFVHGFDPHRPYKSEPVDRAALGIDGPPSKAISRLCKSGASAADLEPHLAEYDAAVHRGDRGFGRLLEILRERGLEDETVVLFVSDHGEEFLEHGRCFHVRTLYREVVRVPLAIRVPGVQPRRVDRVVPASAAIAPTIAEVVLGHAAGLPGPSLARTLTGAEPPVDVVFSETSSRYHAGRGIGHVRALTGNRYKLIEKVTLGRVEIYDLENDRDERRPLDDPALERRLRAQLDDWLADHPAGDFVSAAGPIPRRLERELRALGYVD